MDLSILVISTGEKMKTSSYTLTFDVTADSKSSSSLHHLDFKLNVQLSCRECEALLDVYPAQPCHFVWILPVTLGCPDSRFDYFLILTNDHFLDWH